MTAFKKTFFGKIWKKVTGFWDKEAEPFLESLIAPIVPELKALAKKEVEEIGRAILDSIHDSAAAGLRPTAWLDIAFDIAEAKAKELGKDLSSAAINLLVTAYQAHAKSEAAANGRLVRDEII